MIHKIKLTVITPVHIGTGRQLAHNSEYLKFEDIKRLSLIDDRKVLNIIGKENMQQWLDIINNKGDLLAYLKKRKNDLKPSDVELRGFNYLGTPSGKELREQMTTIDYRPMIPGSSIKGAIKSAVLHNLINNDYYAKNLANLQGKNEKFSDKKIMEHYFSGDNVNRDGSNRDMFRQLQVRDVIFPINTTQARVSKTFNLVGGSRDNQIEEKTSVAQLIETIWVNSKASFEIVINDTLAQQASKNDYAMGGKIQNISWLFKKINKASGDLLKKEIENYFTNQAKDNVSDSFEKAGNMLNKILGYVDNSDQPKNALLRLGFGSGYESMTGNWTDNLSDDIREKISTAARRTNKYNQYDLPKSRKTIGNLLMGYVFLELIN